MGRATLCWMLAAAVAASACERPSAETSSKRHRRDDALRRARVMQGPFNPASLAVPTHAEPAPGAVSCKFLVSDVSGTTPKFDCELPSGARVKVKYGDLDEIRGEAAATRLLTTLGFGADHVTVVPSVRCYGCPPLAFYTRLSMKSLPYDGGTFEDAAISEEGRRLLGDRLAQLSREQVQALFVAARFEEDLDQWVDVFLDKVDKIVNREPCGLTADLRVGPAPRLH